jgi:hypothetical protein
MADLIAVPYYVTHVAFLRCGHAALMVDDYPRGLVKPRFASWYATCPRTNTTERITGLIERAS